MITARPLTAEELNELATRAAAAVSMGLQAADDTQARMLATITQLAERYSELHRQNGLLRGERDQARAELAAMREELGERMQFRVCQSPHGVIVDWTDVAGAPMQFLGDPSSAGRPRLEFRTVAVKSQRKAEEGGGDERK